MMRVIRVHQYGGPEVLRCEELTEPEPGPGQIRVRVEAIGVNFVDVYQRNGAYPVQLPYIPGREGAGVVDAVGEGVTQLRVGERVAWAGYPGAYAEKALVPEALAVPLPAGIDFRTAAAVMLQGMTAHYLVHSAYPLGPGKRVLIHAGAGGVGLLAIQMARQLGATVYTTVSNEEKAAAALEAGAHGVILYTRQDVTKEILRLTGGEGVHVVYDSVGKDTLKSSLDSLAPRGCLVVFGQSSGAIEPVATETLASRGSLFLTRTRLQDYIRTRDELLERASAVLDAVAARRLKVWIHSVHPLAAAPKAHRLLEGRKTIGKVLLVPSS